MHSTSVKIGKFNGLDKFKMGNLLKIVVHFIDLRHSMLRIWCCRPEIRRNSFLVQNFGVFDTYILVQGWFLPVNVLVIWFLRHRLSNYWHHWHQFILWFWQLVKLKMCGFIDCIILRNLNYLRLWWSILFHNHRVSLDH